MKQFCLAFLLFCTVQLMGQNPCPLACNQVVYVSLNPNGPTEITPDMILEGNYANCIDFDPVVSLEDFVTNTELPNSPFVDASNLGQSILAIVTDLTTGNACWGQVIVDDPTTCQLICRPITTVYLDDSQALVEITPALLDAGSTCDPNNMHVEIYDPVTNMIIANSPFVTGTEVGAKLEARLIDSSVGKTCSTKLYVQNCENGVDIEIRQVGSGNEVLVDLVTTRFEAIVGFQFSLNYDGQLLKFDEFVSQHPDLISNVQFNGNIPNAVGFSWTDINIQGVTLPDESTLLTLKFTTLQEGDSEMQITSNPVDIEFINTDLEILCLNSQPSEIINSGSNVTGHIYKDKNDDCLLSPNDIPVKQWLVKLSDGTQEFYGATDENGKYLIFAPPGNYTLTAMGPNSLWGFCENDIAIELIDDTSSISQDFLALADVECAAMRVNISTPFLRRCFDNKYTLKYCNEGTVQAQDAFVEVVLDDDLIFVSSSHNDYTVSGQTIVFELGNVEEGDCGSISFVTNVNCNTTVLGQTHCVEAKIYPNEPCTSPDPAWTGASLQLEAECLNDEVVFNIKNIGLGDMAGPLEFIVIEDDVMLPSNDFFLTANEAMELSYPADGTTYRLLAEQEPFHPGESMPSLAMEGCTEDPVTVFTTGFVTMFSNNDLDPHVDIDCQESIGSYDPNDKQGFPKGYREEGYIKANTKLDYKIRFQNTGTDTAFTVVIKDQINPEFDLSTLVLGTSSHDFSFEIEEGHTLVFTFNDILLVDSTRNEPESHGFVTFSIDQVANHEDGTLLLNDAEIFFDFNEAVVTNTSQHEVGSDFVEMSTRVIDIENIGLKIYPNPAAEYVILEFDYTENSYLEIYDQLGQIIKQQEVRSGSKVRIADLQSGMYNYRVVSKNNVLAIGQFTRS